MELLLGAVWWPSSSAATCHPKKATVALAEQAKQSGVNIIEHAEVSDLNNHEDMKKWKVTYRILKDRLGRGAIIYFFDDISSSRNKQSFSFHATSS